MLTESWGENSQLDNDEIKNFYRWAMSHGYDFFRYKLLFKIIIRQRAGVLLNWQRHIVEIVCGVAGLSLIFNSRGAVSSSIRSRFNAAVVAIRQNKDNIEGLLELRNDSAPEWLMANYQACANFSGMLVKINELFKELESSSSQNERFLVQTVLMTIGKKGRLQAADLDILLSTNVQDHFDLWSNGKFQGGVSKEFAANLDGLIQDLLPFCKDEILAQAKSIKL